jgi:hypothetical protein
VLTPLKRAYKRSASAAIEPRLDNVYADPVVHLEMERDGVSLAELQRVVIDARRRLAGRLCQCGAA